MCGVHCERTEGNVRFINVNTHVAVCLGQCYAGGGREIGHWWGAVNTQG